MVVEICPLSLTFHQQGRCHQGIPEKPLKKIVQEQNKAESKPLNRSIRSSNPGQNHVKLLEDRRVPLADLLLQETPTCPEAMQAQHLCFLVLLHGLNSPRHSAISDNSRNLET
jgi:hypothetical protein